MLVILKERIGHIDGCRALAVLGVVLYHAVYHSAWAQRASEQGGALGILIAVLSQGAHGVDLFFVVSGFCLSYPTLAAYRNAPGASFRLDRFLAKRLARIVPPYYAALLFFLIAVWFFRHCGVRVPSGFASNVSFIDVVRQAFFLDRGTHLLTPSFWTLSVELRWYALFPLLLALWMRAPRAYFSLLVSLVVAYTWTRARSMDLGILPAFMLGIVAAD